jgi:hypothetical protein
MWNSNIDFSGAFVAASVIFPWSSRFKFETDVFGV